jgi:hypothetical protein
MRMTAGDRAIEIIDSSATHFLLGVRAPDRLYRVDIRCSRALCHTASTSSTDAQLWQRRFAHTGYSTLASMARTGTVTGLPNAINFLAQLQRKSHGVCAPCAESKHVKMLYPLSNQCARRCFEKFHVEIAGPKCTTAGGNNYFTVVVDDATVYTFSKSHPSKADSAEFVKCVIEFVRGHYSAVV